MQSIRPKQLVIFLGLVLLSLVLALGPGRHLLRFAYYTGDQSYILLIPVLSAILIFRDRDNVFAHTATAGFTRAAIAGFSAGIALIGAGYLLPGGSEWEMVATALGLIAFWTGAYVYCFGENSARAALFPLGMLLWMVPIPAVIIDWLTKFLQDGSTELVAIMFRLTGVPVLRDGYFFHLPGQSIEVAKECSGIRSSLVLMLLTMVIAHESLRGNARRAVLMISTIPIVILKNGIRITSLTLLAIYVDPSFLTGPLHHQGGIVFFLIGMAILIPIIALLRKGDPLASRAAALTAHNAG
jgi:exosortase